MFGSHCSTARAGDGTRTLPNQTTPAAGVLGGAGAGLAYVGWLQCLSALCTPAPQLREQEAQELQEPQAPSMGWGRNPTGTHSPLKHHCRQEREHRVREREHWGPAHRLSRGNLCFACMGSAGLCLKQGQAQRCRAVCRFEGGNKPRAPRSPLSKGIHSPVSAQRGSEVPPQQWGRSQGAALTSLVLSTVINCGFHLPR